MPTGPEDPHPPGTPGQERPPEPGAPDACHRRDTRVRNTLGAVFAVHGAVSGTFASRIPWLRDHLGLSEAHLGLMLVAPALGAALAMTLTGRLLHRHGGRTTLRLLLPAWCTALALPPLAPAPAALFVLLVLFGATAGMSDVAMNAAGSGAEARRGRSLMPALHGMWSAGALTGAAAGALAAGGGLDARLHLATAAALLAAAATAVTSTIPKEVGAAPAGAAPPRFAPPPRRSLLIGAAGFCAVFAEGAGMNWSAVHLEDVTGAPPGLAAATYALFTCTMTAARLASGRIVDRLGPAGAVRVGGAVATLGAVLIATAHAPAPAIAGFALLGIGVAAVLPLAFAAAGRMEPDAGRAIAGVATVTYTSGLIAPALVGAVAGATSLSVSFALVAALTAILVPAAGIFTPAGGNGATRTAPGRNAAGAPAP